MTDTEITRGMVQLMPPDQVLDAYRAGKLNHLLAPGETVRDRPLRPDQITREDLAWMTPDEINTARHEGRLTALLTGTTTEETES